VLANIPEPAADRIAVRVTPAAERAVRKGHPWVFAHAVRKQKGAGRAGDLAVVFDRRRRFLAVGLYDPHSPIRVRVLQHGKPADIDREWFRNRLSVAAERRTPLRDSGDTTGYRLVHGENDGLPGLVLDRYAQTLVLKLYTAAWLPHLRDLLPSLPRVSPAERVVLRLGRAMQEHPPALYGLTDGTVLVGPPLTGAIVFRENGLCFEVDPVRGQKTGFFLDQRENRSRVAGLSTGKAVLDIFCYTGGFSLYAACGGARAVVSVDVSQPALGAAVRNFALNRHRPTVAVMIDGRTHELVAEDAFEALARLGRQGRHFGLVIIDPPAFAKRRKEIQRALSAHERLTRLGLGVLEPGGTLVQACCSSRIDAETFFTTLHRAAALAGRPLREIERTSHPLDHPIGFREGAYLKCLFAVAP
jgi:23S rRNA (cytosine1962-C5)-methyltransferase